MPEYVFKTVYFPRERVRAATSARVSISLPKQPKDGVSPDLIALLASLNSREFRLALGDPYLEDLEAKAHQDNRSLSNVCIAILKDRFATASPRNGVPQQHALDFGDEWPAPTEESDGDAAFGVTFRDNLRQGIHGWYPYVEGFSASYARDALLRFGKKPTNVYDPFGGSGTIQLSASLLSIPSFYSELNPFMSWVTEAKVTSAQWARTHLRDFERTATAFLTEIQRKVLRKVADKIDLASYHKAFPNRDFFVESDLRQLLAALQIAKTLAKDNIHLQRLLTLACAANAVGSSNMTRRADLRRRRPDEYKGRVVDVSRSIAQSLSRMVEDVKQLPPTMAPTQFVSADAKQIPHQYLGAFDFVLTSPPYLNGTNYFRNTKLELWLLSFIASEDDLRTFRSRAVTAGINDVYRREHYTRFGGVEAVAKRLDKVSRDQRIQTMIRHYFSDMFDVMTGIHRSLVPGGKFLLDIGDSRFYGVHVPTDTLLVDVAREAGFTVVDQHTLARRISRDKTPLVQVELLLERPKQVNTTRHTNVGRSADVRDVIHRFQQTLPYKALPYSKKTWGHPLHMLCSYQGKLKPSLSYWLIREFMPSRGRLLDPIGGVGTIAFEGALAGHEVVSNDKSPFAALVARAKLRPPSMTDLQVAIARLRDDARSLSLSKDDYKSAEFGLNASVKDYYHADTLTELLRLRKLFRARSLEERSDSDNFAWACLLHVLHGNRPYALSRTSHPITPFAPSGPTIFKCPYTKILERAQRVLNSDLPESFRPGLGIEGDFRDLPKIVDHGFDVIMTSPPFYGMRFDRPNWLRMWFCGWSAVDFKIKSQDFLERQQTKDITVYREFFATCKLLLKQYGLMVLHLGSGGRRNLVEELREMSREHFVVEGEVSENVQGIAKHGVNDKGLTSSHALLFLRHRNERH